MYVLKKMESYLRVNLFGPSPRLMIKEFTGPRSHKGWETLVKDAAWAPTNNKCYHVPESYISCGQHSFTLSSELRYVGGSRRYVYVCVYVCVSVCQARSFIRKLPNRTLQTECVARDSEISVTVQPRSEIKRVVGGPYSTHGCSHSSAWLDPFTKRRYSNERSRQKNARPGSEAVN